MSKTVTWKYKGKADVVYGEVHISPIPKIILAITMTTVAISCVIVLIFQDFIYDLLTNPQIMLKNVNQDENGFYIEIPYSKDNIEFVSTDYIDEVNTRQYESFIDPNNNDYTFNIEEHVDTTTIGEYEVVYNSQNRVKHNEINLTVRVKDIDGPIVILKDPETGQELSKMVDGTYYGITLHRNTDEVLNWNAKNYILAINDNYSNINDINVIYPETPNFNTEEDDITVIYLATDTSGNTSETKLKLFVTNNFNTEINIASLIDKKEQEQQLTEQNTQQQNNNNRTPYTDHPTNDNGSDGPPAQNLDGTNTVKAPSLTADNFTWSVSSDGLYGAAFFVKAQTYLHYYNFDGVQAYPTSGPGITYQFDVGTYTIHWKADNGLECDQTVTITE